MNKVIKIDLTYGGRGSLYHYGEAFLCAHMADYLFGPRQAGKYQLKIYNKDQKKSVAKKIHLININLWEYSIRFKFKGAEHYRCLFYGFVAAMREIGIASNVDLINRDFWLVLAPKQ